MSDTSPTKIGRYELGPELGRGGMARVHLGRLSGAVGFTRPVAIKSLHPGMANDASFVKMFIDEARLAAHVHHPNVVAVHDVVAEDGALYLVMEYVPGATLDTLLAAPVPVPIVLALVAGTLAGLHAAHDAHDEDGHPLNIVHRDVSPQNVIVSRDGVPKLLDFGVAKARSRMHSTANGEIKGKLPYMSPEQLTAKAVDRRSDVFSTGVMLWELLTGERLFHRDEEAATVFAVMSGEIEPPSSRRPEVTAELDAIVLRCLARDPDQRYADARAALVAIEALGLTATVRETAAWVQARLPQTPTLDALTTETQPAAVAPIVIATPVPKRRPVRLVAGVAMLVAIAGIGGTLASRSRDEDPPPQQPPPRSQPPTQPQPPTPIATPSPQESVTPSPAPAPVSRPRVKPHPAVKKKPPPDCRIQNPDGTIGYRPECLK